MSSGISSKPEQAGHGAPFLSFRTVFNNHFLPVHLEELMDTSEQEQNTYSIKKGDIFLTRTSETIDELGMSSVAIDEYPRATFSGFLKRLRPIQNDITYDKYMAFYLRSRLFRKTMTNNAIMTLRASLNEDIFSYLNLYLPDYESQKRSGDLLYSLNSKIELNNRINAVLEAMAKTLYDYWFVQFDFPNHEGKPYKTSGGKMVWNEELKRDVPEGWKVEKMSELYDFQYGLGNINPENGGQYPIYGSNGVIGGYDKFNNEDAPVIGHIGNNCGSLVFADGKHYVTYNGVMCNIKNGYDKYFGYVVLLSKDLKSHTRGSSQPFISYDMLYSLNIVIPDKFLLKKYCDFINPLFDKLINNKKENQQLSNLRDWLLPMLMNGQVKVG